MTRRAIAIALVASAVALSAGFLLKNQCTTHDWDGYQYRRSCYTDVIALYSARGLDREPIPYVHGNGQIDPGEAGDLEYPVGTGYFVAATARWVTNSTDFFRVSAIGLALAGAGAAVALATVAADRRRLLLYALGPPLVLYAFHNWDLLAVLAMAIALAAFARSADTAAGLALGIGAATKVFPGVLLPVFVLARLRAGRGMPWGMVGASVGAFVAWNVPVMLANFEGWMFPWRFQSERFTNFETSWYFIYRHLNGVVGDSSFWFDTYPAITSVASVALFAIGAGALLGLAWRRGPAFNPYATAVGVMAMFLLTAKVYSPQFALWLLPLFVLARMPWQSYLAFVASDAFVWISVSAFLLHFGEGNVVYENILEVAVFARYVVLGWLVWLSTRVQDAVMERDVPVADPVLT